MLCTLPSLYFTVYSYIVQCTYNVLYTMHNRSSKFISY